MRLLVLTNDFPPAVGGIENYTFSLVRRWNPSDVVVLTRWMPGCERFDRENGFETVREPVKTLLPTPGLLSRAKSIIRERRIDAVHFPSSLPLGLMGPRLGRPYAVSVHGGEFMLASRLPAARQALHAVSRKASVVLPESSFAEHLVRRFLEDAVPVVRVTCGVDAERYAPSAAAGAGQHANGPTIVSISRLIRRKGQKTLIRAFPLLLGSHPQARLLIVGGGPCLPRLKRLASTLDVHERVTFTGPQPWERTPGYLASADIFALPTRARFGGTETEGLPLVLLEAAASALPLVAGDVGGIRDAVRPGETGLLVDGSSPQETFSAIASLLNDHSAALRMGARAREMVLEEFTWERVFREYRRAIARWCA